MLIQSEYLNVKYYSLDGEIYVALDKSLFYDFLLKEAKIKNYLKNTPKRLVLSYEDNKIYQRSTEESLKLSELLSEMNQLAYLKISFPGEMDLAILVFEILKEVKSFVGIEFDQKTCPDMIIAIIFKKYILGFPPDGDDLAFKVLTESRVNIYKIECARVARFVRCLTPAWPKLKYFYFELRNAILSHYQTFTDINLCSPLADIMNFNFDRFYFLERRKILLQIGQKVPEHVLSSANVRKNMLAYNDFLIRNRIPHYTISPFDFQFQYNSLPRNYFIINNNGTMSNNQIRGVNFLRNHYKLASCTAPRCIQISEKFTCTIDQLHLINMREIPIKNALNLFLNVKKLFLYLDYLKCLRGLKSEHFQQIQSITVYIKQDCLIEFLESFNSVFETLKIEKSIAPIVESNSSNLMNLEF